MNETRRGPAHFLGHWAAQILVGLYVVADSLLSPLFRPFMRWLSSLHIVQQVETGIAALPPYAVLVLFAIPLAIEEVIKFYGLILLGGGHFKSGLLLYVGAHVFAILICERIFSAGKDKLLMIPWFAKGFRWLEGYKDRLLTWVKASAFYQRAGQLKAEARQAARLFVRRTKSALGW